MVDVKQGTSECMDKLIESTFTVLLGMTAHRAAAQQCQQVGNPQKAKQVYLNYLAMFAVEYYLRCMGIETNRDADPQLVIQTLMDEANLQLPGLGHLECCFVLPDQQVIQIASDAWENRIGYVVVQLEPLLKKATVLGFVQEAKDGEILVNQLRSLDQLMSYLQRLRSASTESPVSLSQWLQGQFKASWQSLDDLLNTDTAFAFAYRTEILSDSKAIKRAKLLNLGLQLGGQAVALLVAILPEPEQRLSISVQVHPMGQLAYLPAGLHISLRLESGETLQEVRSRSHDNYIQLRQFHGSLTERFKVQVSLDTVCVTESFVI